MMELEGEREASLDLFVKASLTRTDYERWSWEGCTKMSSVWLHSPPDQFGYIEDLLFGVMFATYLGQPCPAIAPVVGRFFGNNGARVDAYGANLPATALPGRGWSALHAIR